MGSLSQKRAKEIVFYNPLTGIFIRKRGAYKGHPTGSKACKGKYLTVHVDGNAYYAHRLAWLIYYGEWPENSIDHINGDGTDNSIKNLRDVPHKENLRNCRLQKNNTSGYTGVEWNPLNRNWRAKIKVDGKVMSLGSFKHKKDAAAARRSADQYYGFHNNHGQEVSY